MVRIHNSERSGLEAQNTLSLHTVLVCLAIVIFLEFIFSLAATLNLSQLGLLGILRALEAGGVAFVLASRKEFHCIGLNRGRTLHGLYQGILWSLGFGVPIVGILAAASLITPVVWEHILATPFVDHISLPKLLLYLATGIIIGPIAEELFFRGIVYNFFRYWGITCAVVVSTCFFALLHSTQGFPVVQIIGGILFAVSLETEKNLLVPIVIHISGNTALFVLPYLI